MISASTTDRRRQLVLSACSPDVAPCDSAALCAYIAAPRVWLAVAVFSVAALIASMSSPSSAVFSSATAASTSALTAPRAACRCSRRGTSRSGTPATRRCCGPRPLRDAGGPPRRAPRRPDHPVDLVLGQGGAAGDLDRLLLAGALVLGGDVHDAVGVDVEGDLDLRDAARRRRQAGQLERAELLVVRRHLALALVDLDLHRRLVVVGRGEDLRALGRDRGVALDEPGHDAALGLDAERQRGDVEQQDVLDLALEHAGLQRGADGDDLVRVDALVGLLAAGELLDQLGDGGHAGRATDEHDLVDVGDRDAGVLDDALERRLAAVQQVGGDLLELRAGELLVEEQRVLVGVDGDVGQVDRGLLRAGQLDLRLLGRLTQPLHRHLVLGQVDAVRVLERARRASRRAPGPSRRHRGGCRRWWP